ncbi:hypothetical protein [Paenibacillus ginsengarvi]|uniref:Uncharacterized protein n=1 Tax=Paenibacillus ginsengarvi TaxID=400777 RepID=A0A3B0BNS4_9BACL|nr:hypothetical protein [Paenibacillus ginsengarvi]RKN75043.1 hypothetical protein D7M11_26280 [Paenibacillus ginsengarvi]
MMLQELSEVCEAARRLSELESIRAAMTYRPGWFNAAVLPAAMDWLDGEIMQLEAELLVFEETENERSRLAGRLLEKQGNLIRPSISQWRTLGKGDMWI